MRYVSTFITVAILVVASIQARSIPESRGKVEPVLSIQPPSTPQTFPNVKGKKKQIRPTPTTTSTPTPTVQVNAPLKNLPTPTPTLVPAKPTPTNTPIPIPTATPTPIPTQLNAQALLSAINVWRNSHGLGSFTNSDGSCWIAEKRLPEVVNNFSHDGFEEALEEYAGIAGILFWNGGENIARGAKSAEEVVSMWEISPGHNAIMSKGASFACTATEGDVAVLIVEYSIIK